MHIRRCFVVIFLVLASAFAQESIPAYRNPKLPVEQRVADLLGRMTLEEKVDQLAPGRSRNMLENDQSPEAKRLREGMQELFKVDSQMSPHDAAVLRNEVQKYVREKTRLGIPVLFMGEALHGFMSYGATSFPQALGLASTWDPNLVRQSFTAIADEMSAAGVRQAFTPVLGLARDRRAAGNLIHNRPASCDGDRQALRRAQ
jgi:beta-glucosidase